MILSGILLAIAIKVIVTTLSISILEDKTTSRNNNLLNVSTIFQQNFLNSSVIETNENGDLIFWSSDKKETIISFKPSFIIISGSMPYDTIQMPCDELHVVKSDSTNDLVISISFIVTYNNINYPFFFLKNYTNQVLFNLNENAD